MRINTSILVALCCGCFTTTLAQQSNSPGNDDNRELDFLDPSFGNNGVSVITPDGLYSFLVLTTTLVQDNGDLVGIGFVNKDSLFNFQIALFRTDADGQPDFSFGNGGWTFTDFSGSVEVRKSILQPDGKILVTGSVQNGTSRDVFLVRYTSEGIPDSTFGYAGIVLTDVDGNTDYAFDLTTDESGNIFVAGKTVSGVAADILVISYDESGVLRSSFGIEGKKVWDAGSDEEFAVGICVQTMDRIIIGGESAGNFLLAAFNASADLDLTFGQSGITNASFETLSVENASDFLMDAAGQFYLTGTTNATSPDGKKTFAVARFDANGLPDFSYGVNGLAQADAYPGKNDVVQEAVLLADGELILTGYSVNAGDYAISTIKLTSSGEINQEFDALLTDFDLTQDVPQDIFVQQDGKIVVSGYAMNGSSCSGFLMRYDPAKYLQAETGYQSIQVYPNPATTRLFLEITGIEEPVEISVCNSQGQLMNTYLFSELQYCQVDVSQFENGCYYLLIPQMNVRKQFMVIK